MRKLSKPTLAPAGLLRASANSTRHSLLAENLVLDDESKNVFALLHQEFIDRLNPTDGIEVCLVEDLASTVWRQRRLVAIETHLFKEAAAKRPEQTYLGRIGGAFSDLCRTPDMHLLDRYESRLHRMFQRTVKNLELLRRIEHTDPSTGELTQLPAEVTGIPDADPATPELPNEPRSEQPPVESASYPTTSTADSKPDSTEGGADFSIYGLGPSLRSETDGLEVARTSVCARRTLLEINKLQSGFPESLLPTGPTVPLQQSPQVPPTPPTTKIHEIPNEPKSAQPAEESTLYPETLAPNSQALQPVDPYAGYPQFELDPRTGNLRRIA
jgi:hypothetical protein